MTNAIAAAAASFVDAGKVSRQKKDALFDLASRIGGIAADARGSDSAVAKAAAAEKRKGAKAGLEILATGADPATFERAYAESVAMPGADDPGSQLEWLLVRAGLRGIAADEHYSIVMRRMAAYLGPDYFDKAEAWLSERAKKRRSRGESLVFPGELPDVVRILAMDKRNLERVVRVAGHEIAAAALAGCPQESMDLVRPLFGKIGATALEDDAVHLRARLSSDEIEQAQAAFLEVLRSLDERGELSLGPEEELVADPSFVTALTKAVLGIDPTIIKSAFRQIEGALIATAMQGMEPEAHDRILGSLPKKETKRILNAIDEADPLPKRAVQGAGKLLAERLFEAAGAAKAPKAALERLAAVRDWEG
jgi:Flagellar motor switch protein